MNTKKIFVISSIGLALVIGTLIIYNIFLKNNGTTPNETTSPSPSASTNTTAQKVKPISQEKAIGAVIGTDGKTVKYYTKAASSDVWESSFDGSGLKKIATPGLKNILKIIWSPDKEKVMAIAAENNTVKKIYFNYQNNEYAYYDDKIGYLAWSPDSKKIVYQYTDIISDQSSISVAEPNGTNWKNVFKTRLNNLIITWPTADKISLQSQISGLSQGFLFALNPTTGNFEKIISDTYGLNAKWSSSGDKIIYSKTDANGKNPGLYLAKSDGQENKNLNLAGLVDKCVWSKDGVTIFCALPQKISTNNVWPDDYYKGLIALEDDFYKIDLTTNTKIKIAGSSAETDYDAQEIFLSPKEDYLFFVNKKDGLLYSLKL